MLKKLITLFKLGRKVAKSDILTITSKFKEPPLAVKVLFKILSFSFSTKNNMHGTMDEHGGHAMLSGLGHEISLSLDVLALGEAEVVDDGVIFLAEARSLELLYLPIVIA